MTADNALVDHLPTLLSLSGEGHLAESLGQLVRSKPPDSTIDWIAALDALSHTRLMSAYSALLPAHEIEADAKGYVIFARENQEAVVWAYRTDDKEIDPIAYQSPADTGGEPSAWYSEDLPLSSFLVAFAYWNLAQGAAIASGYGEASSATKPLLQALPSKWVSPALEIRGSDPFAILNDDNTLQVFGSDRRTTSELLNALKLHSAAMIEN